MSKGYNTSKDNVVWSKAFIKLDPILLGGTDIFFSEDTPKWFRQHDIFDAQNGASSPTRVDLRYSGGDHIPCWRDHSLFFTAVNFDQKSLQLKREKLIKRFRWKWNLSVLYRAEELSVQYRLSTIKYIPGDCMFHYHQCISLQQNTVSVLYNTINSNDYQLKLIMQRLQKNTFLVYR